MDISTYLAAALEHLPGSQNLQGQSLMVMCTKKRYNCLRDDRISDSLLVQIFLEGWLSRQISQIHTLRLVHRRFLRLIFQNMRVLDMKCMQLGASIRQQDSVYTSVFARYKNISCLNMDFCTEVPTQLPHDKEEMKSLEK